MFKKYINEEIDNFLKQKVKSHRLSYIFLDPIEGIIGLYPSYTTIVQTPIDLNIISKKAAAKTYSSVEEFKDDITMMCENCKVFNANSKQYCEATDNFLTFFKNNFDKTVAKITKNIKKEEEILRQKHIENNQRQISQNKGKFITVISNNNDEERVLQKIISLLLKISPELNNEEKLEETAQHFTKNIIRKTNTFDIIYDDMVKFLNNNMKNKDDKETKSKILKKFRKMLRAIMEEQKVEDNKMILKINNKETKLLSEQDNKILIEETLAKIQVILDNQKIPEVYRENGEYPIDVNLKNRISNYIDMIDKKNTVYYYSNGQRAYL